MRKKINNIESMLTIVGAFILLFLLMLPSIEKVDQPSFCSLNYTDSLLKDTNPIYSDVDKEAVFKDGGDNGFIAFFSANFKMPKQAKKKKTVGKVYIQFIVERDGTVSDVKIINKSGATCCGVPEECLRVVKLTSGKWEAGSLKGNKVRTYWRFPLDVDNSDEGF